MRHTVIGLFNTYVDAEAARETLVQTGFARDTIDLQANAEPSVGSATEEVAGSGVLANIERFLASLFASGPRAPETARYTEAVRRGAVLVVIDAASESHAELARNTLTRLGATDIGERPADWNTHTASESAREHSLLDELGIGTVTTAAPRSAESGFTGAEGRDTTTSAGTGMGATMGTGGPGTATWTSPPGAAGTPMGTGASTGASTSTSAGTSAAATTSGTRATPASSVSPPAAPGSGAATHAAAAADPLYTAPPRSTDAEPFVPPPISERPATDPLNEPMPDPLADDAGRSAIAAGSVPGSGAVMQPSEVVSSAAQPTSGLSGQIPNEYLEYEEDFRTHYDEQYSADDSRYEDYVPAYRYGAEIGQDVRYRDRAWDDVEPEARRHWESTAADSSTWERFKLAVRHGWERVTGHHHV
ncbi:hypothetical protein [Paraburkholderia phenoliruptrix]|uniref:hypothetical protein n=1 Tax=Paraburkholderia phenoliruptrix TaxID=252970 RepID=UPI001C4FF277|nr:hypothetical protein [Paraburkholderia phenoliruptrix]MBW0445893.1 hypothetical protein [Paraburkholderia phenoliruptrix]MBW9101370.1 hypothetical protein [Paraburkholderia phenoliruptrix]